MYSIGSKFTNVSWVRSFLLFLILIIMYKLVQHWIPLPWGQESPWGYRRPSLLKSTWQETSQGSNTVHRLPQPCKDYLTLKYDALLHIFPKYAFLKLLLKGVRLCQLLITEVAQAHDKCQWRAIGLAETEVFIRENTHTYKSSMSVRCWWLKEHH